MTITSTVLRGRIFNRDFIARKRVQQNRWEFGKKLNKFRSYQFGRFSLYVSLKPIPFIHKDMVQGVRDGKTGRFVA